MMKHTCIKVGCGNSYEDTDPDPYYCPPCMEQKKKIAEEVDKKLSGRPKKPHKSLLQEYDEAEKVHGFVRARL